MATKKSVSALERCIIKRLKQSSKNSWMLENLLK